MLLTALKRGGMSRVPIVRPAPPGVVALALQIAWHAVMVTRPRKRKAVKRCRRGLRRAIRHIENADSADLVLLKQTIPGDVVEHLTPLAIASLREGCKVCGQCALRELTPP